jgi:hypothetical protein
MKARREEHKRIITRQLREAGTDEEGKTIFTFAYTAECSCSEDWWEECGFGKGGRLRATHAYRDHLKAAEEKHKKPDVYEPDVDYISDSYYYYD